LLAVSVTGPVNPLIGVTVTVKAAVPPREIVCEEGAADTAKSVTVKFACDVAVPPGVVTAIGPVVAPAGTVNESCVSEATEKETEVPLSVTPVAPVKPVPVTVTDVPAVPLAGENDEMVGGTATMKDVPDEPVPFGVVTAIGPLVAPLGTVKVSCVSELTVKAVGAPLSVTAVAPVKFAPVTMTDVPTVPLVGENDEITGDGGVTMKADDDVAVPPGVVTAIGPLVAPLGTVAMMRVSDETVNADAGVPAKDTDVAPLRPVPEIVTLVPTGPLDGLKDEIVGTGGGPGGGIGSGVAVAPLFGAGPRPKYLYSPASRP
jgi:hypothetical protein